MTHLKMPVALLCAVGAFASPALAQGMAAAPAAAAAQDDDGGSALSSEIIVTAQRREQGVQKVGIAITAYSGEQLRALNVTDSRELASFSPGVHLGGALAGQIAKENKDAMKVRTPDALLAARGTRFVVEVP